MKLPRFEILMGSLNGAAHLNTQLASIALQQAVEWNLTVSDDGSTDQTRNVVERFAGHFEPGKVTLIDGPRRGVAPNFMRLLLRSSRADSFLALADQDDVWHPRRLARAARLLGPSDSKRPQIYASATWHIDGIGRPRGGSRELVVRPSFGNALLQNVLPGNTIILNAAAANVVRRSAPHARDVPFHDWWLYALLSGAGAEIIHDPNRGVSYRQHKSNHMGARAGLRDHFARARGLANTEFSRWVRANAQALGACSHLLSPANKRVLRKFQLALDRPAPKRAFAIKRSGAHRQSRFDGFAVLTAAAFDRI